MCIDTHDLPLQPGLAIDEIEKRLMASAERYQREERRLSYYLLDVQTRNLFFERGFSSIYDFAMELVGLSRRKTQYLLFIARKLAKLPAIADAFDTGEIGWTKVREILKVATPDTQGEWLDKANKLKNRELEKLVRKQAPSEAFATLRISLPEGMMNLWVECETIAERDAESELEPWQVLEQMMAEYLSTYAASTKELLSARQETEDEKGIVWEVRQQVVDRDDGQCQFPGCSMRAQLGLHHIQFRSRGGDHSPENLITLCAAHHTLVHQHICGVKGQAPNNLTWKGPFLDKWSSGPEQKDPKKDNEVLVRTVETEDTENLEPLPSETSVEEGDPRTSITSAQDEDKNQDDKQDWATKEVAAIFDGPGLSRNKEELTIWSHDVFSDWCDQKRREIRKKRRFGKGYQKPLPELDKRGGREHVFAEKTNAHPKKDVQMVPGMRHSREESPRPEPV
jgi:hypothetical protein